MKKLFSSFLLLGLLCAPALPRQQQSSDRGARLIDSFGNILLTDIKARLDNFVVELQNTPNAKGFIVVYPAKNFPGWPLRRTRAFQDYLINARGIEAAHVAVVNGGFRDEMTFELWTVSPGAELPVRPFDISLMMIGEKTPLPFDRFPIVERGDLGEFDAEDSYEYYPNTKELYEPFVEVLRRDPTLRGCVIAYAAPRNRRGYDRILAGRVKMAIAKAHTIDVSRITAFGGGKREEKMVELWLVPPGVELPKPTPTVRPARRKRR
jgi:hypothetical protein